jgi:hypothetical protein
MLWSKHIPRVHLTTEYANTAAAHRWLGGPQSRYSRADYTFADNKLRSSRPYVVNYDKKLKVVHIHRASKARYKLNAFLTWAKVGVSGQLHNPSALTPCEIAPGVH